MYNDEQSKQSFDFGPGLAEITTHIATKIEAYNQIW